MKRYAKPTTDLSGTAFTANPPQASVAEELQPGLDFTDLLDKATIILQREIVNLMMESSGKKLSAASSRDLATYIKLLMEVKADEAKRLAALTDDELAAMATAAGKR